MNRTRLPLPHKKPLTDVQAEGTMASSWLIEHPGVSASHFVKENLIHTEDIKQISAQATYFNKKRAQCIVFTTGGTVDHVWLSAQSDDVPDLLNVSELFPNGAMSVRVTNIPGSPLKLSHDWRVVISANKTNAPKNVALINLLGKVWAGNLVLMKYDELGEAPTNIAKMETDYAVLLLGMWFHHIHKLQSQANDTHN